ncbi:MAG: ABC transporter substrate-binding protein [Spirochaetes bacterium]|nr:ABC transporter substrate-binding protein [Spirochaetota bacterium]
MANTQQGYRPSFFDRPVFGLVMGSALLCALLLVAYFIDFVPGLGGMDIRIFSGVKPGGYNATVDKLAAIAAKKKGVIRNVPTNGSLENLEQLADSPDKNAFALAQTGLKIPDGFELVARLSKSETVFFFGRDAFKIKNFSDLKGKKIGIGPEGSGAAHFARTLYEKMNMAALGVTFSNHTSDEQMKLLKNGGLDLAVMVFADNAEIVESAVIKERMEFATFRQAESIAKKLHFLRTAYIREGYYDPIKNIPAADKQVLKLDTMVLCKKGTRRSQIIGLLTTIQELEPDLVIFNNTIPNLTGVSYTAASRDYFANHGPEIFDVYAPRLMDFMPLGNLVQILMAISVFFNLMNVANRFFLWRVDANRVDIETELRNYFGRPVTAEEIALEELEGRHANAESRAVLDALIDRLTRLGEKCRKKSLSLLVPMGKEQAYRYQEEIINRFLSAMKAYREKMQ